MAILSVPFSILRLKELMPGDVKPVTGAERPAPAGTSGVWLWACIGGAAVGVAATYLMGSKERKNLVSGLKNIGESVGSISGSLGGLLGGENESNSGSSNSGRSTSGNGGASKSKSGASKSGSGSSSSTSRRG
ncbi:MAG: hypothetical protein EOP53_05360 [Sphingobacteriales bacterium]|nr:MAG: hypothetical protein EOP53_05360 [Sphingobacteriales bacterium]